MLKYIVYTGVAALIVWAAAYLIYRFHQSLKGCLLYTSDAADE